MLIKIKKKIKSGLINFYLTSNLKRIIPYITNVWSRLVKYFLVKKRNKMMTEKYTQ